MLLKSGSLSWEISDDEKPNIMAWLTINRACNLRCSWCYAKMTGYANNSMSLQTVQQSISLLKDIGLNSIILIGGEPTIHPLFLDIVKMIREAGLNAYLVTNAIPLANEDYLNRTIEAGVSSFTVSFKASNRATFKKDTGKDQFHSAIKAVNNLVKAGVHHVVNITACENLMANFDEMLKVIGETGTDKFSIDTGKPLFIDGKSNVDGMGTPENIARFFVDIYPKLEQSKLRFSVKVAVPFCLFPRKFIEKLIADGNVLTGCQMVTGRGIIIDPKGKVLPCNHLCDQFIGQIGTDFSTAKEFWDFRKTGEMVNFYKSVSSHPNSKCVNCPYWVMCGAGCKLYWLHYGAESLMNDFQENTGNNS